MFSFRPTLNYWDRGDYFQQNDSPEPIKKSLRRGLVLNGRGERTIALGFAFSKSRALLRCGVLGASSCARPRSATLRPCVFGKAKKGFIEAAFDNWEVKDDAHDLISWLKAADFCICLITNSVGIYAKHVAKRLSVDNYCANAELYFDEEGNLTDFHYETDQAEVKLRQFGEYCLAKGLSPKECVPIGDSDNDIGLFRLTGNGILVENSKATETLRQASWKTVRSLSEIKEILQTEE